jgi:hypothetical protein
MDTRIELIKQAIDATDGFYSSQSEAVAVNPDMWDLKLRDFVRQNVVITPLAEYFDFTGIGATHKVTIDDEPSAASALVETSDVSVVAFSTRPVTFDPAEYGGRYQLSYAEAARAFFNVGERMVTKLGYAMVIKKDQLAYSCLSTNAGTSVFANGKSVSSDIASTDTLNLADILTGIAAMKVLKYQPKALIISPQQEKQLMSITTLQQANTFGTRSVIGGGEVGVLFGLNVVMSHSVTTANNRAKAIILGETLSGEKAFGYAQKRLPLIESDKAIAGRYVDYVGTEEYDFQALHTSGIYGITTYV